MATTREKSRGRVETRTLTTTAWLNEYLEDWPGVTRVFRLERRRVVKTVATVEVVYGLTSLPAERATAAALLGLCRAHWAIENGLHYVRDVTLEEDACRVRRGTAARALASLRNAAVYLLRQRNGDNLAAATRELAAHPDKAVAMLAHPAPISA